MKALITGSAGFIGFHLVKALLARGDDVVGIDSLNDYYDPQLKIDRLAILDSINGSYEFIRLDISHRDKIEKLFQKNQFDVVVNLAAQPGVRYSIDNPHAYVDANLVGFLNILEGCRRSKVKHLVYASSSSVYGMNTKQPFSPADQVDFPISFYAATKKSNELMAFSYSHLYQIPTTGLRFFTAYGPYGRPDMAYFKFTKAILEGRVIDVYNNGKMERDFTYIDDIIESIVHVINRIPEPLSSKTTNAIPHYKLYNVGNNQPITLRRLISAIENACGKIAIENVLPMQAGDVPKTFADIDELIADTGFSPKTNIEDGIKDFVGWYKKYVGKP